MSKSGISPLLSSSMGSSTIFRRIFFSFLLTPSCQHQQPPLLLQRLQQLLPTQFLQLRELLQLIFLRGVATLVASI
jgi:hypothetical protein